ncbi:hypothetical protein T08_318 [Trichinella sp. T8]|nr:hypothetical protein T08_318 [Trichinella sp. T8]
MVHFQRREPRSTCKERESDFVRLIVIVQRVSFAYLGYLSYMRAFIFHRRACCVIIIHLTVVWSVSGRGQRSAIGLCPLFIGREISSAVATCTLGPSDNRDDNSIVQEVDRKQT